MNIFLWLFAGLVGSIIAKLVVDHMERRHELVITGGTVFAMVVGIFLGPITLVWAVLMTIVHFLFHFDVISRISKIEIYRRKSK